MGILFLGYLTKKGWVKGPKIGMDDEDMVRKDKTQKEEREIRC